MGQNVKLLSVGFLAVRVFFLQTNTRHKKNFTIAVNFYSGEGLKSDEMFSTGSENLNIIGIFDFCFTNTNDAVNGTDLKCD